MGFFKPQTKAREDVRQNLIPKATYPTYQDNQRYWEEIKRQQEQQEQARRQQQEEQRRRK